MTEIVLDLHRRGIDTSELVKQKDKEDFWETITLELLLERESLDRLKELDPFEILLRSKIGFPLLDWSSIVSGQQRPNNPPPNSSSSSIIVVPKTTTVLVIMAGNVPPPPAAAPARYAPLVLPVVLNALLSKYSAKIKIWGSDEEITAKEHVDQFNDFIDREEIDHEDVKMRLFSQSFTGEVRKWFKALVIGSLQNWNEFEDSFLRKWGNRENHVKALTEYNSLKRAVDETVQNLSKIFNKVYDSIPAHLKPPPGAAQLRYA